MAVKNNRRMAPEFTSFRSFDVNKKKKKTRTPFLFPSGDKGTRDFVN